MALDKTRDFFLGAIDNLRDPFKTTKWRMLIPGDIFVATGISPTNGDSFGNIEGEDNLALHIKSAKVPEISIDTAPVEYMGWKSYYPTNAKIDGEQDFDVIMLEDMRAYEAILGWQQSIFNTGVLVDSSDKDRMGQTGLELGMGNHKVGTNPSSLVLRNSIIRLELYNSMVAGDVILRVNLINATPVKVSGPSLNHSNAELAKFSFALKYDRWSVHVPSKYLTGKGDGNDAFSR